MKKSFLLSMMAVLLSLTGCQKEQGFPAPKVTITPDAVGETTLSFKITPEDAEKCAYMCIEAINAVPTVDAVLESGISVEPQEGVQTVDNLKPSTRYYIVAAVDSHDRKTMSRTIAMTTAAPVDPQAEPKVDVVLQEKTATQISFKIVPKDAVKCSYVYVEEGAEIPSAQEIIDNGVRTFPNAESVHHIDGLYEGTPYVVVAAVQNGEKLSTTELKVETSLGEELTFVPEEGKGHKVLGNNYFVRLSNGENVLSLDFFATESEVLPEGSYILSSVKEEFVIWTTSSKFGKDGQYTTFQDGEVNVQLDGKVYTISFYMVMDDATVLTGSYTGELEGMFVEFPEYEGPGSMKFSGADANHLRKEAMLTFFDARGVRDLKVNLYFPRMDSKKYLPLGEFPMMDQAYVPGSYASSISSNLKDIATGVEDYFRPQGSVTIAVENGEYVVTFRDLITESGVVLDDVYRGQINGVEVPVERETVELTMTTAAYEKIENAQDGEFSIMMTDGASAEMMLNLFGAAADAELQAGTYKYGEGENTFGGDSYLKTGADRIVFKSGSVKVTVDGAMSAIAVDAVGSDDKQYVIMYTGEITPLPGGGDTPDPELEIIELNLPDVKGHFASGNNDSYCINAFNYEDDNSFEMFIYLNGTAGDEYLKPGKYEFSTEKKPFTFGNDTYISFYNPYDVIHPDGGYVNVSLDSGGINYTVELRLVQGGKMYKADYVGPLEQCNS